MVKTTRLSGSLRLITGAALLIGVITAGYLGHSPLIIAPLSIAFTISFAIGRLKRWQAAIKQQGAHRLAIGICATFMSQFLLVALLYLIGLGLGTLLSGYETLSAFGQGDWLWAFWLGMFGAAAGLMISKLEHAPQHTHDPQTGQPSYPVRILEAPVTPKTFFSPPTSEDGMTGVSEADLVATETRLGVKLPGTLCEIFRQQDGGHLRVMGIPKPDKAAPFGIDDMLNPFSGYNDLHACTQLQNLAESFLSFADPEDEESYGALFKNGTENMVLLAQWYLESLFLDYNQVGEPRVGFVDFDQENWLEQVIWWPSFDDFFAALRFYEDID